MKTPTFIHAIRSLPLIYCWLLIMNQSMTHAQEDPLSPKHDTSAPVATIDWKGQAKSGQLPKEVTLMEEAGQDALIKVERTVGSPKLIPLAVIDQPQIKGQAYMLRGRVRYENVDQVGYVEMWNHFPAPKKGAYFSRTLGSGGPMGCLQGSSEWRELQLPFFINQANHPGPESLKINLHLPGKGSVWISNLELIEIDSTLLGAGGTTRQILMWIGIAIGIISLVTFLIARTSLSKIKASTPGATEELRRMQAMDIG